jgi:hypothetical protein
MGGPYEVFVANLSWNTSSDDLAEAFNHVGPIAFARVSPGSYASWHSLVLQVGVCQDVRPSCFV